MLWPFAVAYIVAVTYMSFDGLKAMGLRTVNLLRSLWVVGVALAAAVLAVFVATQLHALRLPHGPIQFLQAFAPYAIWAFVQQFLLQSIFLARLLRLLPNTNSAVLLTALIFSVAHLPNPVLTPVTLILGLAACLIFLHYRSLFPVALAHAILGISIAITVPGQLDHNMRVGLSYLAYTQKPVASAHPPASSPRP